MRAIFSPVRSARTFEEVSAQIKELIFEGVLKPGDRLPPENDLAQQFNVGRQTVREALRILELSGLIAIKKGGSGGPVIENTVLNAISELYVDAFKMERVSIEELTIARCEIEKIVVTHAIDRADDSDFEALADNIERARKKLADDRMATEDNIAFHMLLARASKNHVFVMVVASLCAILGDLLTRLSPHILVSRESLEFHESILDAMKRRDKVAAVTLLEAHFVEVQKRLLLLV